MEVLDGSGEAPDQGPEEHGQQEQNGKLDHINYIQRQGPVQQDGLGGGVRGNNQVDQETCGQSGCNPWKQIRPDNSGPGGGEVFFHLRPPWSMEQDKEGNRPQNQGGDADLDGTGPEPLAKNHASRLKGLQKT